jgi:hypothetical protein
MSGIKALCIGVSQTGKSTFALHLALSTGKQVVIWDANEVFTDIVKEPVYTPSDLEEALRNGEPVIVYDATGSEDRHEEFEGVARVLENFDGHTLLVDEAGDVQRASSPNPGLDRLYRRAGRRGNDIIETTHRPSDVATLNRTLTTDVYLFAVTRGKDVKILSDEFSEEVAQAAAQLPDYVYIHWHARTGEWEPVDDPEFWYVPLDRLVSERERTPAQRVSRRTPLFTTEEAYGEA